MTARPREPAPQTSPAASTDPTSTDELVELARAASKHGGRYIAHIRSEGNTFLEAIDETLTIAKKAGIPVEIYHLKAAGKKNWHKMDRAIRKIEDARANGTDVTANMYTYIAGATGLDASMPPWQACERSCAKVTALHGRRGHAGAWTQSFARFTMGVGYIYQLGV